MCAPSRAGKQKPWRSNEKTQESDECDGMCSQADWCGEFFCVLFSDRCCPYRNMTACYILHLTASYESRPWQQQKQKHTQRKCKTMYTAELSFNARPDLGEMGGGSRCTLARQGCEDTRDDNDWHRNSSAPLWQPKGQGTFDPV